MRTRVGDDPDILAADQSRELLGDEQAQSIALERAERVLSELEQRLEPWFVALPALDGIRHRGRVWRGRTFSRVTRWRRGLGRSG